MSKKVTIGITTFNRNELLKECIRSVCNQTYENLEVLIGNDFVGRDVSLAELGISDTRVRVINNRANLGEFQNMNMLLQMASGEYFTWLADDDLLHPMFLTHVFNQIRLKGNESIIGVFTGYEVGVSFNLETQKKIGDSSVIRLNCREFLPRYFSKNIEIIGCYGVFKKSTLMKIGGIQKLGDGFGPYSDTALPVRLCRYGDFVVSREKLLLLRAHSGSLSASTTDMDSYLGAERDFLKVMIRECIACNLEDDVKAFGDMLLRWFLSNHFSLFFRAVKTGGPVKITVSLKHLSSLREYYNGRFPVSLLIAEYVGFLYRVIKWKIFNLIRINHF